MRQLLLKLNSVYQRHPILPQNPMKANAKLAGPLKKPAIYSGIVHYSSPGDTRDGPICFPSRSLGRLFENDQDVIALVPAAEDAVDQSAQTYQCKANQAHR